MYASRLNHIQFTATISNLERMNLIEIQRGVSKTNSRNLFFVKDKGRVFIDYYSRCEAMLEITRQKIAPDVIQGEQENQT